MKESIGDWDTRKAPNWSKKMRPCEWPCYAEKDKSFLQRKNEEIGLGEWNKVREGLEGRTSSAFVENGEAAKRDTPAPTPIDSSSSGLVVPHTERSGLAIIIQ